MSADNDNTIVLEHKSLDCPLRVCSFWLRDHCRCAKCYGETSQRKFNIIDIPIDIKPIDLKTEDDNVCIKCKLYLSRVMKRIKTYFYA